MKRDTETTPENETMNTERRQELFNKNESAIKELEKSDLFKDLVTLEECAPEIACYVRFMKSATKPQYYLLKEINTIFFEDLIVQETIYKNIEFWRIMSYQSKYIMQIHDLRINKGKELIQFLQEFSPNHSIHYLVKHADEDVCEEEVFEIFLEILCGLEYLHLLGLPYGLLTPRHIYKRSLQNQVFVPSLFPLTKDYIDLVDDRCPGLVPPEFTDNLKQELKKRQATQEADIFCLGSILFYLIEGVYPGEDDYLYYEQEIYEEWKDLIERMRAENPECRPSFDEIYKHKIFKLMAKETRIDVESKRERARELAGVKIPTPESSPNPVKKAEVILKSFGRSAQQAVNETEKRSINNKLEFSTRDNSPENTLLDLDEHDLTPKERERQFLRQKSLMIKEAKSPRNLLQLAKEFEKQKKMSKDVSDELEQLEPPVLVKQDSVIETALFIGSVLLQNLPI